MSRAAPSRKRPRSAAVKGRSAARAASSRRFSSIELRYRELLEHLPVGVYRTTPDGTILECNQAVAEMLGYETSDRLRRVNVSDLYVRPTDRSLHLAKLERGGTHPAEFQLRRRDGTTIWVRDYPRAVLSRAGAIRHLDGILVDVTAEKAAEEALRRSEQDYRSLFENAHDAILIFAAEGEIILEANQRAGELYRLTRDELVGRSLETLSKDVAAGKARIRETLAGTVSRAFETVHVRGDGTEITLEVNAAPIEHRGVRAILSINRDISERKRLEQVIRDMAFHDPLTGLPNRKLLSDRLSVALAHAKRRRGRLALLFLDLDGFKCVNDRWGHSQGDALLRELGGRLGGALRTGDTVARIGGDEFTVLVPELPGEAAAAEVARKVIRALERPFTVAGVTVAVTASVGIALYPDDGLDFDQLLQRADAAMYHAKALGGNRFQWACENGRGKSSRGSPSDGNAAG